MDEEKLTDYLKIIIDFKSIPQHKQSRTFMEICGYPHYENVCSNILQFFLNPTNEHGLKDLMLNSMLQLLEKDFKFETDIETIDILREYPTLKGNRLDLIIITENYVVGIENKIFHHLHNDLNDYEETVKSLCTRSKKPVCIILSLNELSSQEDINKAKTNNFSNITYEELFHNIKLAIGQYIDISNNKYTSYLTDFMKTMENLTPRTMENKRLWTFFKNNTKAIQELTNSFNHYKEQLNKRVFQLKDTLPINEFAPSVNSQWIYSNFCLVHDYIIYEKYAISIDTYIRPDGWTIEIFGRNSYSTMYFINTMCKENSFLASPFEEYEINSDNRLIYQKFDVDANMSDVREALEKLLLRFEKYKREERNVVYEASNTSVEL